MNDLTEKFDPAPFWRRLAAMVYDSVLMLAIWMVVAFIVLSLFGIDNARTVDGETVALDPLYKNILLAAMILSAYAFFGWFWTHSGQTLGMQAWRVRVVNNDGGTITAGQSVSRFALALVSCLLFGLGFLMMLFNSKKETLHDRYSNTQLVLKPLMENKKD